MNDFLNNLIPTFEQLIGLFAVVLLAANFTAVGALVSSRTQLKEAQLLYGWAVAIVIFTVAGAVGIKNFTLVAGLSALIFLPAIYIAYKRHGGLGPPGAWKLLILAIPILALGASMTPTQWDELTQWLPNARFLVEHDSFPRQDLPASPSVYPAYPYGLSLIIYFASRIAQHFVENAAALFSLILYLSFGLFISRLIVNQASIDHRWSKSTDLPVSWTRCAFAGLLVTALNPTYVTRLVFSSYSDAPTSIIIGFAVAIIWMTLNALSEDKPEEAKRYSWQLGLVLTVAIGLKQVNLVFLISIAIASMIIVWRDPTIEWRHLASITIPALALPLIVYGAWRYHVALHIPGGEFAFRPIDEWYFSIIPDILAQMGVVASKKGGYFGIMLLAIIIAAKVIWRPRTDFDRLVILAAIMFLAYNSFLLLTYVAAFSKLDALRVGSYWRYNTHLGGVCLLFVAYMFAMLWRRYLIQKVPKILGPLCIALVVFTPVAMSTKLRFDSHPRYEFARSSSQDMFKFLSPKDRLLLVDPVDDGNYLVIMRYRLYGSARIIGEINSWSNATTKSIRQAAEKGRASHIWIYSANSMVSKALEISLPPQHSYLLARSKKGWSVVLRWPQPRVEAVTTTR